MEGSNNMSFLSFFEDFSFQTHWQYILYIALIIALVIILIIFVRKHIALTVTIIIFGGLLVGYYFGNLYFALGFSENMTCDALRKNPDEYVRYELDEVYIYQKKNIDDNNNIIDNSSDIFAVKKLWFVYYSMKPTRELKAEIDGNDDYTILIKEYKVDDNRIYQFVPQEISLKSDTVIRKYLDTIEVTYVDNSTEVLSSEQLYIFQVKKEIKSFTAFNIEYKLGNSSTQDK